MTTGTAATPPATRAAAIALIEAATSPGGLFGDPDATPASISLQQSSPGSNDGGAAAERYRQAHEAYRRLARLVHPDATDDGDNDIDDGKRAAAFAKLAELWRRYRGGDAGDGPGDGHRVLAYGDIASLVAVAGSPGQPGLLKLARNPADNDLITRESAALRWLADRGDPGFAQYVPDFLRGSAHADPATGIRRRGNVLARLAPEFVDLSVVRDRFPGGLDPRDVAWIWRRVLVAIGFAHGTGLVHGAVVLPHIMIWPAGHGLVLVDWCYSCGGPNPGTLPALVTRYRDWYPPEVGPGYVATPDLDIYLATRSMVALMRPPLPAPLSAFAAGCTLASPARRPRHAWELLRELDELIERLWGPRTFRPFPAMAAPTAATAGN